MILRSLRSLSFLPLAALLAGCAMTSSTLPGANPDAGAPGSISGILHGGPSPVVGATVKLWVTAGTGYGDALTSVTSAVSGSDGGFTLTLPTTSVACPAGQFAYVTAAGGSGGTGTNNGILLMTPIGACSSNYTNSGTTTITNTYTGPSIWIDELTTAISAYALAGFMTVSGTNVYIDAPANNMSTATQSATAPTAAGLSHAFANALNLMNISTGQPYATYANRTGGGIVPVAQILSLGNILQACVNSTGTTGTNNATSNDGSACGMLFSLTTPPYSGAAVPSNTMGAMLDLAKFPAPQGVTWNSTCTASTGGTNTAVTCLYDIAPPISGPYANALAAAPPDWALAVVYQGGYGATSTPACAVTGSTTACSGLNYPYYVATDYADNVYVLNQDTSAGTTQNILGFNFDGTEIVNTAQDTTYTQIKMIGTDLQGHVLGVNSTTNSGSAPFYNYLRVYSTGTYTGGAAVNTLVASTQAPTGFPLAIAVDPNNGVYYMASGVAGSLRRFSYNASSGTAAAPVYVSTAFTPADSSSGGALQISLDSALNVWVQESSATNKFYVNYAANSGTATAPAYGSAFKTLQLAGSTVSTGAEGIVADNNGNAYAMVGGNSAVSSDNGFYKVTYTSATSTLSAGSLVNLPLTYTYLDPHFAYLDGAGNIISPDNANGTVVTGISVYDVADGGIALGTWKGCLVQSTLKCGTTASSAPTVSPRAAAIDSAGTVWVASGASHTLTEFIGAAAPTWPALANVKFGKPQ